MLQRDIPGTVFCIPNNVPTEPVEWPDGSRHMEYYWWTFTEPYPLHNIQIGYGNRYVYLDPYFMGAARDPGLSVQQNLNTQFMVWEAFREVARKLKPNFTEQDMWAFRSFLYANFPQIMPPNDQQRAQFLAIVEESGHQRKIELEHIPEQYLKPLVKLIQPPSHWT